MTLTLYWAILLALVLLQLVASLLAWRHLSLRLDAMADTRRAPETTSAPDATLLAGLARVEQRLAQLEHKVQSAAAAVPQAGDRAYDLAQRMARNGADPAQIAEACGIALHEAELLSRLHAPARPITKEQPAS